MPTAKEKTKTKTYKAPVSEYFTTSCDTELTWGGGGGGAQTQTETTETATREISIRQEVKYRKSEKPEYNTFAYSVPLYITVSYTDVCNIPQTRDKALHSHGTLTVKVQKI